MKLQKAKIHKVRVVQEGWKYLYYIDDKPPLLRKEVPALIGLTCGGFNSIACTLNCADQEVWIQKKLWLVEHGVQRSTPRVFKRDGYWVVSKWVAKACGIAPQQGHKRCIAWEDKKISNEELLRPKAIARVKANASKPQGTNQGNAAWRKLTRPAKDVHYAAGLWEAKNINPTGFYTPGPSGFVDYYGE